ncbi:MAG TPA: hypothetical protein VI306_14645 [Pyrinomonadaceae bacterium]
MTIDERLDAVWFKVKWAEKHIGDLNNGIAGFIKSKPYKVRAERDPLSRQPTYYIDSIRDLPRDAAAIAGDAIQNLRSALDHLNWHLVEVGCLAQNISLSDSDKKRIAFPIIDHSITTQYETEIARKVKGMRQKTIDKINDIKPYKGGNDLLWKLHKLNNIDKHRFLLTAGLSLVAIDAKSIFPQGSAQILPDGKGGFTSRRVQLFLKPSKPIYPLQKDTKLFVDVPDAEINLDDKFRFDVTLNEPQVVEGEPIGQTLIKLRNAVKVVIDKLTEDLC